MDYKDPQGAEFRAVRETEHAGEPARAIEMSRVYATGAEDLWEALTSPERLPRWFLPIRGDLKVGGSYQLEGNAGGRITRCDPPEALDITWEFGGMVSWVSVRLVPEAGGVRLTLVHTTSKDEASEAHWAKYGPGATGVGWDLSFLALGAHLESGGGRIDPEQNEAWMVSEPGKAFLRVSAEAWGRAHVEAGEDAEVVRAIAGRTAAFYTGS